MKRFSLLSVAIIAVLMVFAIGCTTLQESAGGYEEMPRSRVHRQMPYGSNQVIVVERDPFTGQYYQVNPYGYYGSTYSPFGYDYGYGRPAYPRGSYRGGGYYRGGNGGGSRQAPQAQQPQRRSSPTNERAKEILRGN